MTTTEQVFAERFFRRDPLGPGNSMSGTGSSLARTTHLRRELPVLLADLNIRDLLDLPCGDFNWMKEVELGEIRYIGGDVISDLIKRNRELWSGPLRTFERLDLAYSPLPRADVVMCRDCLVHLSNATILAALRNICTSGAHYLLTTHYTFRALPANNDIPTGSWRRLNFELAPFYFPPPRRFIVEGSTEHAGEAADKTLALWPVDEILTRLP